MLHFLFLRQRAMSINPGGKEAWQSSVKSLLLTIRHWLVRQAWQDCGYIYRCCNSEVRAFSWIIFSAISAQRHSQAINSIDSTVALMHIFPVDMKIRLDGDRIEDLEDCHTFNKHRTLPLYSPGNQLPNLFEVVHKPWSYRKQVCFDERRVEHVRQIASQR